MSQPVHHEKHTEPEGGFLPPYRVLDLTDGKGVFCTRLLADYGADVVRLEPPGGDPDRRRAPFPGDDPQGNTSLYFTYFNTNKKSVTLNLESEGGRLLFRRLVQGADALVESMPVGYLAAMGLDYPHLALINPGLVMASISPFGQSGPWRSYKSSDLIAMAASGYMQVTGEPDEPPLRLGNEHSHYPAAQYAAVGLLAALYHRDGVSGQGQYIDISQQEALLTYYTDAHPALLWQQREQNVTRVGANSTLVVPLGAFPCSDGWVAAGVITRREWDALAQWMYEVSGDDTVLEEKYRGGTQERFPYKDEVSALFMDFTARFTVQELFHQGQARNLVFLPVNEAGDLLADPQLEASQLWHQLEHPHLGTLAYPLGVFQSNEMPTNTEAAPATGQHNQAVYCGELGLSPQELVMLREAGTI